MRENIEDNLGNITTEEVIGHQKKEDDLLFLLSQCGHYLHHKRGGKRGQGRILKILAEHEDISQKDLQELLGIESGSMSEIMIKLESKGLITRTRDEADKRLTRVSLTEFGKEHADEIGTRDSVEDATLLDALNEDEQKLLRDLLKKLLGNWEETYGLSRMERHCKEHRGHSECHKHGDHSHHGHGEHHGEHGDHHREHHGEHKEHREEHREHHGDHHEHGGHHEKDDHHGHIGHHEHRDHHGHKDHHEHKDHHGHISHHEH